MKKPIKQISFNNGTDTINSAEYNTKSNLFNKNIINSKNIKIIIDTNSKNNNDVNSELTNSKKHFRSSTINNCIMKNNIFLPDITSRLKNNIPRYYRQSEGFLIEGIGKFSFKNFYTEDRKLMNILI